MFRFGSDAAKTAVEFVPGDDAREWIAQGLAQHANRLGLLGAKPQLIVDPMGKGHVPRDLDGLFDLMCGVQEEIGQEDVEFTLLEIGESAPRLPDGFAPLGDPTGQMLHGFHRDGEYVLLFSPGVFRVPQLLFASVARELGRIAIHLKGGHETSVEPPDFEADAELASVVLGMGVWVANGAYVYENACCGGGCGIDLKSLRAGLSMPEAVLALALDGHRKGLSRRAIGKHLEPTQRAAFKKNWSAAAGQQLPMLGAASNRGELGA
jgi:hypothetical protein